jgi:hypothetical protein
VLTPTQRSIADFVGMQGQSLLISRGSRGKAP